MGASKQATLQSVANYSNRLRNYTGRSEGRLVGRLTDWSLNELTRRGPDRELESSGRTRRQFCRPACRSERARGAAQTAASNRRCLQACGAGHTARCCCCCLSSAPRSTALASAAAAAVAVFSLVRIEIWWRRTSIAMLTPPAQLSLSALISECDDATICDCHPTCQHYANY